MRKKLKLPATPEVLEDIGELIRETCENAGFSEDEIGNVALAVDEACTNTIKHGLRGDTSCYFVLEISNEDDGIEIVIHENGVPFDPAIVHAPDLKQCIEDRPVGGLGVFLIQELMDEVEYSLAENGLKTLRMMKKRS